MAEAHIYSYDPLSQAARTLTRTGLSFEFERGFMGAVHIRRIIQTGERGSAELKPAGEKDLGPGGLKAALGGARASGSLYQIAPGGDGRAFIQAVCPGAERAWLMIGPLERFHDLEVRAVGRDAGAASARPCSSLEFGFHSDWRLPEREAPRPRFGPEVLG